MQIDVKSAQVIDVYQMLVGLVAPRPIAWVTTLSASGSVNLAPLVFQFLWCESTSCGFSADIKRDGSKKIHC